MTPAERSDPTPAVADPTAAAADRTTALLDDDRLTAMGLLIETFTGIAELVERDMEALGLGMSSFEVMLRLARSPERRLRMTELAAQSTLTSSGLTRVVDRLSRIGYVERVPCATDRRGWFASLTDDGFAQVARILPDHVATVERCFTGNLAPDQLESFLTSLRDLRAIVRPGSDPLIAAAAHSSTELAGAIDGDGG